MWQYIVPILVGVIASLLAPIVQNIMQALVQNSASRSQRRRDLVDEWRRGLAEAGDSLDDLPAIRSSQWYERLRPYLSDEVRKTFEHGYPPGSTTMVVENFPRPPGQDKQVDLRRRRNTLAARVDELAEKWKVD
ncbi:hypothetical protein B7C42_07661 [Nocardia cerradoensis]|uniref:Uncharacterized protein n=1 Tax=Nocardia cerradoensis TaxID=85688 RepID=A0A231GUE4_9NOCA|nr:hypothetical protein [Nocardia cerradoensis]OXR40236.1 hypothetical protein B7C42_07661 [Nocardia cerradoensis]